jgi:NADH-quinone oxidoreductase subunit E/NADP-reducing hydrogenase subunit HndA
MENNICLPQERIDQVTAICGKFNNDPGELINILHSTQSLLGYLPKEVQQLIADRIGISAAEIWGVVSFYSFFTMTPKGKHPIAICMGTACYVRGAEKILDEFKKKLGINTGETTEDGLFSLDALRCVGACGLAPVVIVGEKVYGRLTLGDVQGILDEYKAV